MISIAEIYKRYFENTAYFFAHSYHLQPQDIESNEVL